MHYPTDWDTTLSKKPICGVLSVAVIAGKTFAEATQAVKNNLMPHQKRHGGKTYIEQRVAALRELGVRVCEHVPAKMNLRTWIRNYARFGATYMVTTSGHVVTVRDGIVMDQVSVDHYESHACNRYFVRHVVEVL